MSQESLGTPRRHDEGQPADLTEVPDEFVDGATVTLTGPEGSDYRLELDTPATGDEIAAIAAAVSSVVTAGRPVGADEPDDEGRDPWTLAGRHAATGGRARHLRSTDAADPWTLSGRAGCRY